MAFLKRKKTIGFWAGDENNFQFVEPLMTQLSKSYKVTRYEYFGDDEVLRQQLKEVDLAWFEWGNGPVIAASHFEGVKVPFINRIHRYEVYSDSPRLIKWERVNRLLFSSPSMLKKFEHKFPDEWVVTKPELAPIGVDTRLFAFHDKPITKQLIYVGRIHPHKNPALLLQIFAALLNVDPEYRLTVTGRYADELYEEYFTDQLEKLGIVDAVTITGPLTQSKIVKRLQDSDFFILPSIIEGLSQAALEAMACGVRPVISNYYGSNEVFTERQTFNTIHEAVELIVHPQMNRRECRDFVEPAYSLEQATGNYMRIIKDLLAS